MNTRTFSIKQLLMTVVLIYAGLMAAACLPLLAQGSVQPAADLPPDAPALLVFSKTAGYRHPSISDGIAAIQAIGVENGLRVDASEDATIFSDAGLAPYQAVIFLSTTGNILNDEQQAAFERYIRNGGAFVGVHAASDTEYDWPWYGGLVGAYFANHPAIQDANIQRISADHPSTAGLPEVWQRRDEWYNFRSQPSDTIEVLLALDESSYEGGTMGAFHPISWAHTYDGGRSWYTGMGHTSESFSEPLFRAHLAGGILWAIGQTESAQVYLPTIE